MVGEGIRILALCIAALFAAACVHKARAVEAGAADNDPIARVWGLGPAVAPPTYVGAAAGEALIAVALVAAPGVGLLIAAAVLFAYAVLLRRLSADEGCHCFGELFAEASRRGAIARNLVLSVLALAAGLAATAGRANVAPIDEWTVGCALIALAAAAAGGVRDRLLRQGRTSTRIPKEVVP